MTTPTAKKTAPDAQQNGAAQPQDQPQRSRNARAQARHRAKRKAYMEQLEETVTKLQAAMNLTPEQVAAMPPAQIRIRELEQENARLRSELDALRLHLDHFTRGRRSERRDSVSMPGDEPNAGDRESKRRRLSGEVDGVYLTPGDTPPHVHNDMPRLPPPSIPHQQPPYGHSLPSLTLHTTTTNGSTGSNSSNSLFMMQHPSSLQVPTTPASSSSSTPPYPTNGTSLPPIDSSRGKPFRGPPMDTHQPPPSAQRSGHSSLNHSPTSATHSHLHLPRPGNSHYNNYVPPPFSQNSHYEIVPKSEDEYNNMQNHDSPSHGSFQPPPPMQSFGPGEHESNNWHVYSAERAQIHQ